MYANYTEEQYKYISNPSKLDTKLIACAGSGKTRCIIGRIMYLIENKLFEPSELLVLTFSRFTQQDFIRRLDDLDKDKIVLRENISTIDAFAKKIIDKEIDADDKKCNKNIKD